MDNLNWNRGFPRRNAFNDRRYGYGSPEIDNRQLNEQIQGLRQDIRTMSNSILNLYNLAQTNNLSISNIENIIYNNRHFTPLRANNRLRAQPHTPFSSPLFNTGINDNLQNHPNNRRNNNLSLNPLLNFPPSLSELTELDRLSNLINRNLRTNNPTTDTNATATDTNATATDTNATAPNSNANTNGNGNEEDQLPDLEPLNPTTNNDSASAPSTNTQQIGPPTNAQIEALIFSSLVNSLNNELPLQPRTRRSASMITPNILEVSYSTENVSNDIVNFIRGVNNEETSSNIITTHATISRNTEIIVKGLETIQLILEQTTWIKRRW